MSDPKSRRCASQYKQKSLSCQAQTPLSAPVRIHEEEPDGKPPMPILIGAGLLLAGAGWALGTRAFAWLATHPVRLPVTRRDKADDPDWEDIKFSSRDGLQIAGWFAPAKDLATARGSVILCHGHPMNRAEMISWARLLHHAGFHTLLFDFRAMGESEGDLCSIGYHEVHDLLGAVDYLAVLPQTSNLPIGAYGISMGGAVCLMAAAQEPRLAAIATHGAYASLDRAIRQRGRLFLGPAGAALSKPAAYWGKRWLNADPSTVSPSAVIAQIAPRPVLLMHGALDMTVSPADAQALYQAAEQPKTLTLWPRSWHVRIHSEELPAYETALVDFFTASFQTK